MIVNVLLVYTHYFGWLIIGTEVIAILYFQRIKWRRIVVMFGICVAAFFPWVLAVSNAATSGELAQNIGWIERPTVKSLVNLGFALIEPFYSRMSSIDPWSQYEITVPLLLIAILAIALFAARPKSEIDLRTTQLKSVFIIAPVVLVLGSSWLMPYSIWGTRHLIFLFPLFAILLALAVMRAEKKWVQTTCTTLIVLFSGWAFVIQATREEPRFSWCAWEPMEREMQLEHSVPVYATEDLVAYHLWFGGSQSGVAVTKVSGIDGLSEDPAYFMPRGFGEIQTKDVAEINDSSLLLAYRAPGYSESEQPLRNFLVKGYRIKDKNVYQADGEVAIMVLLEK